MVSFQSLVRVLLPVFVVGHMMGNVDQPVDGNEVVGMRQCPCFCSVRTGDPLSPYWDKTFGPEFVDPLDTTVDEEGNPAPIPTPKCHTSCLDSGDHLSSMPFCGQHIEGFFCPRKFPGLNLSATEQIALLDAHAKKCVEGLLPKENPLDSKDLYVKECMATMKRGACYVVFPQCKNDAPQGICKSFCLNERRGCRALGTTYGHQDSLRGFCAVPPWVDADGPSDKCTGAAFASAIFNPGRLAWVLGSLSAILIWQV